MHSPGINGEGELRGQPANQGSPGKMAVKTECVCVCVCVWIDEFETQLLCVCALFKDDIRQLSTVAELADFLIVNLLFTAANVPRFVQAFLLFLTLP